MILIVGTGFAGSYLLQQLHKVGAQDILATVRSRDAILAAYAADYFLCDLTKKEDVRALTARCGEQPLTVFYFAACHNVDDLLAHPEEARRVNIEALDRFLSVMPNIEKLLFASTDCVYGESGPGFQKFKETDATRPINLYGEQKKQAEQLVLNRGFTAVRFSYMFGPSLLKKQHFYDRIANSLLRGESVTLFDDMIRSALSYKKAMELLAKLACLPAEQLQGVVNLCSDGAYSKYDLGLMLAKRIGVSASLIKPIATQEGASLFQDRRASRLVMDNTKLKELLQLETVLPEI